MTRWAGKRSRLLLVPVLAALLTLAVAPATSANVPPLRGPIRDRTGEPEIPDGTVRLKHSLGSSDSHSTLMNPSFPAQVILRFVWKLGFFIHR